MNLAIVGSRRPGRFTFEAFCRHIPTGVTRIISGGATGIDAYARRYAVENRVPLTEILPDYANFSGKIAPVVRNREIVRQADYVLAFWDGRSPGTRHVISFCLESGTPHQIIPIASPSAGEADFLF